MEPTGTSAKREMPTSSLICAGRSTPHGSMETTHRSVLTFLNMCHRHQPELMHHEPELVGDVCASLSYVGEPKAVPVQPIAFLAGFVAMARHSTQGSYTLWLV